MNPVFRKYYSDSESEESHWTTPVAAKKAAFVFKTGGTLFRTDDPWRPTAAYGVAQDGEGSAAAGWGWEGGR